jgi:hypothetical protein
MQYFKVTIQVFLFLLVTHFTSCLADILPSNNLNMNFEAASYVAEVHPDKYLDYWSIEGDYSPIVIEDEYPFEGEQSLRISTLASTKKSPQAVFSQMINSSFERQYISLCGYIKYQTLDKSSSFRMFLATYDENSENKSITKYGEYQLSTSSEWQMFEITLPISHEVVHLNIGGVLTGKGLAIVDELSLSFPTCKNNLKQR